MGWPGWPITNASFDKLSTCATVKAATKGWPMPSLWHRSSKCAVLSSKDVMFLSARDEAKVKNGNHETETKLSGTATWFQLECSFLQGFLSFWNENGCSFLQDTWRGKMLWSVLQLCWAIKQQSHSFLDLPWTLWSCMCRCTTNCFEKDLGSALFLLHNGLESPCPL